MEQYLLPQVDVVLMVQPEQLLQQSQITDGNIFHQALVLQRGPEVRQEILVSQLKIPVLQPGIQPMLIILVCVGIQRQVH